jgi:hypothetical protein
MAVGYHSLKTTTHFSNVNLLSSGQQITARLSARKVSVAGVKIAYDPLARDATLFIVMFLETSMRSYFLV